MDALLKNFAGWETTGNPAIDMVAEAVYVARRKRVPLRSISLKPTAYLLYIDFICKKIGEHRVLSADGEVAAPIEFDGVGILKGSSFQPNTMKFDMWPMKANHVEAYKEQKADTNEFPEHLSLLQ